MIDEELGIQDINESKGVMMTGGALVSVLSVVILVSIADPFNVNIGNQNSNHMKYLYPDNNLN